MADAAIGFKIELDTGDTLQKQSSVAAGFGKMAQSAEQAAKAFAAASKANVIDSSGFMKAMSGNQEAAKKAADEIIAAAERARKAQWFDLGTMGAALKQQIDADNKRIAVGKNLTKGMSEAGQAAKKAAEDVIAAAKAAREAKWTDLKNMGADQYAKIAENNKWVQGIAKYKAEAAKREEEAAKAQQKAADEAQKAAEKQAAAQARVVASMRGTAAGAAAAGYVMFRFAKSALTVADAYLELNARLKLVSGSTNEFVRTQEGLYQVAQRTRAPLDETARLYYRMSMGMRDLGRSQTETMKMTELVAKAMKISGASATETAAGLQQFSQAMQAGVLNGDEFRSVMENMPRVARALTDYLHVSIGQLREMSAQGKITAQVMADAMLAAGTSIEAEFKQIPPTVSGSMTRITNAFERLIGEVDKTAGVTQWLASVLKDVSEGMDDLDKAFRRTFNTGAEGRIRALRAEILELGKDIIRLQNGGNLLDKIFGSPADLAMYQERIKTLEGELKKLEFPDGGSDGTFFNKIDEVTNRFTENLGRQTEAGEKVANAAAKAAREHSDVVKKIIEESIRQGADPALMLSLAYQESKFNPNARSPINSGGRGRAKGVFQMLDSTAKSMGIENPSIDSFDVAKNIAAGIKYYLQNEREFKGDKVLAVAAHNAGPGRIHQYGDAVPPPSFAKGQTYNYVQGIIRGNRANPGFDYWKDLAGSGSLGDMEKIKKREEEAHTQRMEWIQKESAANSEAARTRVIESERSVKEIEAQMDQLSNSSQIELKFAIDRKSYDEQLKLLAEQQAKSEEMIRKRAAASGGTNDNVRKAREELKLIEEEIKSLQKSPGNQGKIDNLEVEKKTALLKIKNEELKTSEAGIALQKELADNTQKYDQMRREAGERFIEQQKVQQDQAQRLGATTAAAAKEIINSKLEEVKANVAIAAAQREAEVATKTNLSDTERQREIIQGRLADTLMIVEAEKNAAIEKAQLDLTVLAQEEQMLQARRASTLVLAEQNQIEAQLADNVLRQAAARKTATDAQIAAAQAAAKAQIEAQQSTRELDMNKFKEQQLEMNDFWDQYMSRLRDYADLWSEITGDTENGWSKMTVALGEYSKQFEQIHQQFTDLQGQPTDMAKSWGNMAPLVEGLQQGQAAAAALAKTMLAMRNNVKEGSSAYDAMTIAAENLMQITKLLAVVEGVMGVLHQLSSGDPYTAPARAAVAAGMVAVQLASIGMSSAGVSGMSASGAFTASQTGGSAQTGGGVFGDTSKQSESIQKALDIVAENSTTDLDYSAGILRTLQSIDAAMQGVTNVVIRKVNPIAVPGAIQSLNSGGISGSDINKYFLTAMMGPIGFMMGKMQQTIDPLGKALMDFTFSVKKSITGYGLQGVSQTLADVLKNGFQALQYTTVTTTMKVFGMTVNKSSKDYYQQANKEITRQFTLVIKGLADSMEKAVEVFGIGAEDFMKKVGKLDMNFGRIDFTNLKGEELQKALKDMFNGLADKIAYAVIPGLNKLAKAGEGAYETLIRVANGLMVANGMLSQIGVTAINYTEIIQKQGDISAEVIRQSLQNLEGLGSNMSELLADMSGTGSDIMQAYLGLLDIRAASAYVGLSFETLTNEMIVAGGGIQKLAENLRNYVSNFMGEGSLYAVDLTKLREAFDRLNVAMPRTKEEFVNLVNAQDKTTTKGKLLWTQLINLSGAFAAVADQAQKVTEAYQKYGTRDPLQSYKSQLDTVSEDFKAYMDMRVADISANSKTMNKLPQYLQDVAAYDSTKTNLGKSRDEKALVIDKIDDLDEEIAYLQKKKNKTKEERQRLRDAKAERQKAGKELDAINKDIKDYDNQIAKLDKAIKKAYENFNPEELAQLEEEKAKLLEEQGAAYLSTLSDVFDQITNSLKAAQDTLKSIQDDILNLGGQITGGLQGRVEVATARSNTAELAYKSYTGTDITVLNDLASKYRAAIMEEYQAKLDLINDAKAAIEKERDAAQKKHDEEVAALEKQLGVAKELYDAVKNVQQYVKNLKLSSNSTLSPERKLAEAQARYQELLAKANTGDAAAMRDITGASDAYLEAAKQFYGSSANYSSIFDSIAAQLGELSNYNVDDAQTIQDKIDKLNADHEVYLKGIEERLAALQIEEKIKELQEATIGKLQELEQSFAPAVDAASEIAKQQMEDLITYTLAQNVLNQAQLETLREMAKGWGIDLSNLPDTVGPNPGGTTPAIPAPPEAPSAPDESQYTEKQKRQFRQDRERLQNKIDKANRNIAKWEVNGVTKAEQEKIKTAKGNIEKWTEKLNAIPAFARGGFARPGYALVGEDGPEIVNFERPAQVYNAAQTRDILTAESNMKTFAALEAIKEEVAALVNGQRSANPEIINELRSIRSRVDDLERTQKLKKV